MTTPPLPPLFGFGGYLESGKDTIADYLVEHRGFVKVNMSNPIHAFVSAVNPIIDTYIRYDPRPGLIGRIFDEFLGGFLGRFLYPNDPTIVFIRYNDLVEAVGFTEAKKHPEVRALLQRTGVEGGRQVIGDTVWVDIAARTIAEIRSQGHGAIISGVRFGNEQDLVRSNGGRLIWVDRPGHVPANINLTHATEGGLDPKSFDETVVNDSTLDALHMKAEQLFQSATEPTTAAKPKRARR